MLFSRARLGPLGAVWGDAAGAKGVVRSGRGCGCRRPMFWRRSLARPRVDDGGRLEAAGTGTGQLRRGATVNVWRAWTWLARYSIPFPVQIAGWRRGLAGWRTGMQDTVKGERPRRVEGNWWVFCARCGFAVVTGRRQWARAASGQPAGDNSRALPAGTGPGLQGPPCRRRDWGGGALFLEARQPDARSKPARSKPAASQPALRNLQPPPSNVNCSTCLNGSDGWAMG